MMSENTKIRSIVTASDATRHSAPLDAEVQPSQNEQEAVAARVSAAEVDATGRLKLKVVHLHRYSAAFPHTRTRTAFPSVM